MTSKKKLKTMRWDDDDHVDTDVGQNVNGSLTLIVGWSRFKCYRFA